MIDRAEVLPHLQPLSPVLPLGMGRAEGKGLSCSLLYTTGASMSGLTEMSYQSPEAPHEPALAFG